MKWISYMYTYIPFLLELPPTPHPHPTHLGHHTAPSWAPCVLQQVPTSSSRSSKPPRFPPGIGNPPPSQIPPSGAGPVRPPLVFPPHSSLILPGCLGVPPVSLGFEVPHQHPAGTLVVGRHELHVLPCHHLNMQYSFTFNLFVFLYLKWVSYRKHSVGSCWWWWFF